MLDTVEEGWHCFLKQDPSVKLKLTEEIKEEIKYEIKYEIHLCHCVGLKTTLI